MWRTVSQDDLLKKERICALPPAGKVPLLTQDKEAEVTAQQHDSLPDHAFLREQEIPSILSDFDLHLFGQGKEYRIYEKMGAHLRVVDGVTGVNFALRAPNARSVSIIGDFNGWRYGATPMHLRHQELGVWECFVHGLAAGVLYKYAITSRFNDYTIERGDPYGFAAQLRPQTASIIADIHQHPWQDETWMQERAEHQQLSSPISIYELHAGSWRRALNQPGEHRLLTYRELAHALAPYIKDLGFTLENVRGRVAKIRKSACLLWLHVGTSGQKAPLHGWRIWAMAGLELHTYLSWQISSPLNSCVPNQVLDREKSSIEIV
jgi:Carbohydrate-binding module 48 (Isoamylase N-terminal domain)